MEKGCVVFGIFDFGGESSTEIILVHDKDKPSPKMYKSPGGRLEPGETEEEAFHREITEELGKKIGSGIMGINLVFEKEKENHFVKFFSVKTSGVNAKDIELGEEIDEVISCSPDKIEELMTNGHILPLHGEAIQEYLEKCAVPF